MTNINKKSIRHMVRVLVLSSLISLSFLMVSTPSAFSQSGITDHPGMTDHPADTPDSKTAPPKLISYQGLLNDKNRPASDGIYSITTTLYSDANGTVTVWSGTYKQRVTGGVFSVLLGSGAYPLPAAQDFSKPLWLGVRIDGGEELKPLTQLTGSPFSLSIPDNSVTKDKMAVDYIGSITVNGKQISGKGTTLNLKDGPSTSLIYDEASNSLSLNSSGGIDPVPTACPPWGTSGNTYLLGCGSTFGFTSTIPAADIVMKNNNITQMTMLGATSNGLMFPTTLANGVGVIWQNANTYIHSYGDPTHFTNFFAGNHAGNLTMFTGTPPCTDNTGIGDSALYSNQGGGWGDNAHTVAQGAENTAVGSGALVANTIGYRNTAVGYWALWSNTGGSPDQGDQNTACGACALKLNTTGGDNTATGWGALEQNITGGGNTATGSDALHYNTTGMWNSGFGLWALYSNTTGNANTASGFGALNSNTTASENTAAGFEALYRNTTGRDNTACGFEALYSNLTGIFNTAIGEQALDSNTTGGSNTAIGDAALYSNTTGSNNTASGEEALYGNTTGYNNAASGIAALSLNTTGVNNTATGAYALSGNTTGTNNSASGYFALENNSTGTYNTALGGNSGLTNTIGSNNTFVGYQADASGAALTNASAIGNGAIVGASNTIQLGNTSVTNVSTSGSLSITSAGQGLQIKTGANAKIGTASLAAGTVTVSTTAVTANSVIFLTELTTISNPGAVYVSTISAGTSFVIKSTTGTDASTVAWMIVEKIP